MSWEERIESSVFITDNQVKAVPLFSSTACCQQKQECREDDNKGQEKQDKGKTE